MSVLCYLFIYVAIIFSGNAEVPSFATWYLKVFVLFFTSVLFILALGNHTDKGMPKRRSILSTPSKELEKKEQELSSEEKESESLA